MKYEEYAKWSEAKQRKFDFLLCSPKEKYLDNLRRSYSFYTGPSALSEHVYWGDGDEDIPASICDRNGEVVLALCKRCGLGEIELDQFPTCPGRPGW